MTTDPKPTTDLTRREMWDLIHTLLRGMDLTPRGIDTHPNLLHVTIELEQDDHEGIDRLMDLLRMGKPETYRKDGEPYRWFAGEPGEWTAYGRWNPGWEANSVMVPGWTVKVFAQMVTANHEAVR